MELRIISMALATVNLLLYGCVVVLCSVSSSDVLQEARPLEKEG